jgi:hypothetical protein
MHSVVSPLRRAAHALAHDRMAHARHQQDLRAQQYQQ